MTIRKMSVILAVTAFAAFIIIIMCSAQSVFADADYDKAKNAAALSLNTKDTVTLVWYSERQEFSPKYRKFTANETGLYELYIYNSYGTPNANDLYLELFPTADDAYLYQNDMTWAAHEYLVSEAADLKIVQFEKGKTYYIKVWCSAVSSSYNTYPVKVSKHEHSWRQDTYNKGSFEDTGDGYWTCTRCYDTRSETYPAMSNVTLSKKEMTYSGKAQKPAVKITDYSGKTIPASNYTVLYSNNKNVGKATVTIKGKGNYTGTKKLTFKINPKPTTLTKAPAAKKGFNAVWKKQTKQTSGYQIQYSTNKSFKSENKTVTVKNNKTTKTKVSKLKPGKKYWVRVRTYKTVRGKKYCSSWSKAKPVTTKK